MTELNRKSLRLVPSPENPIKIVFGRKELQKLSSKIKLVDISVGGIGLELPDAKSILKVGMLIEYIELSIPGEGKCTLSGKVILVQGEKCGIEFLQIDEYEIRKIARYIFKREREIQQLKKKYVHGKYHGGEGGDRGVCVYHNRYKTGKGRY